ncbi:MAG: restriction endonuclease [Epibacterium sp.]
MSSLRNIDLELIEEVLRGASKGYVLDFSNRTMTRFFAHELNVDIEASVYKQDGTSKSKRLLCFLRLVDDTSAAKALKVLWDYREALRPNGEPDPIPRAASQYISIINKLTSGFTDHPENIVAAPALSEINFDKFRNRLLEIRDLQPQARGYEFEVFLRDLFDAFRLKAREPFRNLGEQIDGSFLLGEETYLLEAKWLNKKVGNAELGAFHSKLDQKAAWTRGLFISFGGFTEEGLHAFGKGRKLICMEGKEIKDALSLGVGIDRLISLKVRRAAETGEVFVPLENLIS